MTENDWLGLVQRGYSYPEPMLRFLGKSSERKLRLFACACVRRQWSLVEPIERLAVDVAERFADGQATGRELKEARFTCRNQAYYSGGEAAYKCASPTATHAAKLAQAWAWRKLNGHRQEIGDPDSSRTQVEEGAAQVDLLRDIFGNPFRPVTHNHSWLTPTVLSLANGIYTEKAFDRMPILADALQDAGCDNEDILNHCRRAGEHVRGCWVVDLLLSKQ